MTNDIALAVALTAGAYGIALVVYRRSGRSTFVLPVITGTAMTIAALVLIGVPVDQYADGAAPLKYMAQLSVVAMAIPLHVHARRLMTHYRPILAGLVTGCAASLAGTLWLGAWMNVPEQVVISVAPKAATMPLAIQAVEALSGWGALAALSVVLSGAFGAITTDRLLKRLGIHAPAIHAFTLGLVSHAIGVAKTISDRPRELPYCVLGMCANGLLTAALLLAWKG